MKKVNNFLLKAFAVFAIFTMVSCSGDDDTTNFISDRFIGNWRYIGYIENGQFFDDTGDCYNVSLVTNNINKNAYYITNDCGYTEPTIVLNWEKNGDDYSATWTDSYDGSAQSGTITFPEGDNTIHLTGNGVNGTFTSVFVRQDYLIGRWKLTGEVVDGNYQAADDCDEKYISLYSSNTGHFKLRYCGIGDISESLTWIKNANEYYTINSEYGTLQDAVQIFFEGNDMTIVPSGQSANKEYYTRYFY